MQISGAGPDREFSSEKTTAAVQSARVFININAGFIWKKNGFFVTREQARKIAMEILKALEE